MTLDQEIVLGCALRYALGRSTYVVDSVANELEASLLDLPENDLRLYREEISVALGSNQAGMDMDKERWSKCLAKIIAELDRRGVQ